MCLLDIKVQSDLEMREHGSKNNILLTAMVISPLLMQVLGNSAVKSDHKLVAREPAYIWKLLFSTIGLSHLHKIKKPSRKMR